MKLGMVCAPWLLGHSDSQRASKPRLRAASSRSAKFRDLHRKSCANVPKKKPTDQPAASLAGPSSGAPAFRIVNDHRLSPHRRIPSPSALAHPLHRVSDLHRYPSSQSPCRTDCPTPVRQLRPTESSNHCFLSPATIRPPLTPRRRPLLQPPSRPRASRRLHSYRAPLAPWQRRRSNHPISGGQT